MTPSPHCLAIITHCEGEKLTAYRDTGGVLTIGVGYTGNVKPGQTETEAQSQADLKADLADAAAHVANVAGPCTQDQFDALVSLTFNIGSQLDGSHLLHFHKSGAHADAAAQFALWCHDEGKVEPGLVKRRAYEALCYLGEPVL